MDDTYITAKEEAAAMEAADSGLELVQHMFERTPSKYGFPDFDDVANKNLVMANLSRKAEEPDKIMRKADNIITYKRFAKNKPVLVGWETKIIPDTKENREALENRKELIAEYDKDVIVISKPVYEVRKVNRYQELLNEDLAFIQTITGVSAGTDAAVLKLMRSTFVQKDQSIEDKTAPKSTFWGKKK